MAQESDAQSDRKFQKFDPDKCMSRMGEYRQHAVTILNDAAGQQHAERNRAISIERHKDQVWSGLRKQAYQAGNQE